MSVSILPAENIEQIYIKQTVISAVKEKNRYCARRKNNHYSNNKKTIGEVCQLKNGIIGDGGNGKILVKGHKVAVMQDE